jgi:uncharacterized protein (TIGR00290 family)
MKRYPLSLEARCSPDRSCCTLSSLWSMLFSTKDRNNASEETLEDSSSACGTWPHIDVSHCSSASPTPTAGEPLRRPVWEACVGATTPAMVSRRAWVSWSCGKDGAFALHVARDREGVQVDGLVTTVDTETAAVAMSRVPFELLRRQAAALELPVHSVELPWPCPNDVYLQRTAAAWTQARRADVEEIVFGDLFLADVRAYREQSLAGTGLVPRFPLWDQPTGELARRMLSSGLRAVIVCVDPRQAPSEIAGRWWDEELLRDLPEGVDPCGENGEFHTFVTDGPGFAHPVEVVVDEVVERDGFVFAPVGPPAA